MSRRKKTADTGAATPGEFPTDGDGSALSPDDEGEDDSDLNPDTPPDPDGMDETPEEPAPAEKLPKGFCPHCKAPARPPKDGKHKCQCRR